MNMVRKYLMLDEMVKVALKPIMKRLTSSAREEVMESFCKKQCEHGPEGKFCPEAEQFYRGCLALFIYRYSRLN